ncbi:MAG: PAS domain-containing protein, partial [Candidatus Obscuribacterales bacterium]|nr:PAS domain-containing protein [Candidatus Obscuribacterales bacterium]
MSLIQKCAVFLGIIITIQTALYAGFSLFISSLEKEYQKANSSRILMSQASELGNKVYDAAANLVIWGATRDPEAENKFTRAAGGFDREIPSSALLDAEDKKLMNDLVAQTSMCLDDLKQVHTDVRHEAPVEAFTRTRHFLQNELMPQIEDVKAIGHTVFIKHGKLAAVTATKDTELKQSMKNFFDALFFVNVFTVVALAVGFSRGITRRLAVVSENISRYWQGLVLHQPMSGKDEIAKLDASFHEMSTQLAEAREKEQAILRNMPVGIFVCTEDGVIESVNPRSEELLLITADAMIGKPLSSLIEDSSFNLESIKASSLPKVWGMRTATGVLSVELYLSQFHHAGRRKYLVSAADVTVREQMERLKQEFVAVVSHDLRTPLTSIQIGAELAAADGLDKLSGPGQRALLHIQDDVGRLLRLTGDLLEVARLESGNVRLEFAYNDISAIFEKAMDSVAPTATKKDVALHCKTVE